MKLTTSQIGQIETVEKIVCSVLMVAPEDLQLKGRNLDLVIARNLTMYLVVKVFNISSANSIALQYYKKTAGTALCGFKTIEDYLSMDKRLISAYSQIVPKICKELRFNPDEYTKNRITHKKISKTYIILMSGIARAVIENGVLQHDKTVNSNSHDIFAIEDYYNENRKKFV